jgi:hypothetical protein
MLIPLSEVAFLFFTFVFPSRALLLFLRIALSGCTVLNCLWKCESTQTFGGDPWTGNFEIFLKPNSTLIPSVEFIEKLIAA